MTYEINLIENNEVSLAFTKANAALLTKYEVTSTDNLKDLWFKEYRAELSLPNKLIFSSNKDVTMFLLKWS